MLKKYVSGMCVCGLTAGIITGLLGGGGGMVLVPLLTWLTDLQDNEIFPASVSIILPICLVCIGLHSLSSPLPWNQALPYLLGSILGGLCAGLWGSRIPVLWLHRILGCFILWGGIRYLC